MINQQETVRRDIWQLFTNRFAPLRNSFCGASLDEIAQYLHTEAEFLALQTPANTFLARIFWNTVLTPVLSAYRDVSARQRELAEVEQQMNDIRKRIEEARNDKNATPDALIQHARDFDRWQLQLDMRKAALNHATSRLNALLAPPNAPADDTRINHVQS